MKVTRRSPFTGKWNTLEVDITQEQLDEVDSPRSQRRHIQAIVPDVPAPLREFLISGYTPDDWNTLFPPEVE